ncbi:hypothetical protein [Streptomyces sp. YIM B13518]|uniref:hypothetical protein n=1 Tax=Streptomyces sp. YIM B13518 TaxID=3366316 RepID=UPI0036CE0A07
MPRWSAAGIAYMRETAVLYERALTELSGTDHACLTLLNGAFHRATGDLEQLSAGKRPRGTEAVRLPPREAP